MSDQVQFWRARLVKGGPWIGVRTFFGAPIIDGEEQDRSHSYQCLVRTEKTSRLILFGDYCPIEVDSILLRNIERIEEAAYLYLVDHADWATNHAPSQPDASPNSAVNVRGPSVRP